ncbi:MAG: metallophosphoesterase [Candidatus Aureabacteria bacterium]|nr:metallophosphoesterase [Candidatus Auribacterota bacterium]
MDRIGYVERAGISGVVAIAIGIFIVGMPAPALPAGESASRGAETPTTYYFISDLHIGGDGALDRCNFEPELIAFLRGIANGPLPAELIIPGDAFGFWELTTVKGSEKLALLMRKHPALFAQFSETGRRVKITLMPGNHDYELACVPAWKEKLAGYNITLEPVTHLTRPVGDRAIWVEHGNQRDSFNSFPDFGDPYGLPPGYFITVATVAAAGRSAERGRSLWLNDLASVYPTEEIPFWIWSNYFYREMGDILRWLLLPFLLLFTISVIVYLGQSLQRFGILRTKVFDLRLGNRFGLAGRLVDWVLWINGVVISTLLVLAIPIFFLSRDIHETLRRYGVDLSADIRGDKEGKYMAAAKSIFEKDPSVALYIYGHTHVPSLRKVGACYVLNTGTWLKRLERVPTHFRLMPDVYFPSYELSCFTIRAEGKRIRVQYQVIPKQGPDDLTLLQKLMILGRRRGDEQKIPEETFIQMEKDGVGSLDKAEAKTRTADSLPL